MTLLDRIIFQIPSCFKFLSISIKKPDVLLTVCYTEWILNKYFINGTEVLGHGVLGHPLESNRLEHEWWLGPLEPWWLWGSYLTSLSLSLLICKMGTVILPQCPANARCSTNANSVLCQLSPFLIINLSFRLSQASEQTQVSSSSRFYCHNLLALMSLVYFTICDFPRLDKNISMFFPNYSTLTFSKHLSYRALTNKLAILLCLRVKKTGSLSSPFRSWREV